MPLSYRPGTLAEIPLLRPGWQSNSLLCTYEELQEYEFPLIITDVSGKAVTWYLPGALSTSHKVSIPAAGQVTSF